MNTERTQKD